MGIYNPLYNEETGWTPLDQLEPWQQTLMNPSAGGAGYNTSPMQMDMFSQIANQGSTLANPGGSNNFVGVPQQQATNPFLSQPTANSMYGAGNMTGTSGASSQSPVIGSPSLATNMGMTGAQNVGGVGMYTGANGPLDMNLFAPQGQDAAIMQGSMGGLGEMLFKAAQQGGLNPNTSYLGFIDDLSRRALAAKGGQGGLLPQDFVNYMNSQAGQQWFQGMRTPQAPGTPTGSPVIQQTGPQNPPVAPLPPQNTPQIDPPQRTQPYGAPPGNNDPRQQQYNAWLQSQGQGTNPYQNFNPYRQQLDELRMGPQYQQFQQAINQASTALGLNITSSYPTAMSDQDMQRIKQWVAQNNPQVSQFWDNMSQLENQYSQYEYQNPGPTYPGATVQPRPYGQQIPVIGSPGMMGRGATNPYTPGEPLYYVPNEDPYSQVLRTSRTPQYAGQQPMGQDPNNPYGWNPQPSSQPNWNDLTDYGRQQYGMPTAAQWQQMQGGGQQPNYNNIDYRAATFGPGAAQNTQSTPPASGGAGTIPNTTNPQNPLTSQTQYRAPGFGGVTNRLAGFGNTSLFGTPYGSGGSTGFGGTNPSQYRGAGTYGRAASYGQSQRPY